MAQPAAAPVPAVVASPAPSAAPAAATPALAPVQWKGRDVHMGKADLTKVLEEVFGDLSKLPLLKWDWERSLSYNLKPVSWDDLTDPVMALQEKGKPIAVAVRYFDDAYPKDNETRIAAYVIKIFAITNRFNEQHKEVTVEGAQFAQASVLHYSVQNKITAAEGEKLEAKFPAKAAETK